MNWIFDNDRPIYIQIVEQLKIFIVAGKYQSGEKLPSVREFALEAEVNPNTMQKALIEVETMGLIYTMRTSGKYVTEDQTLIKQYKKEYAQKKIDTFLQGMNQLGINQEDIIEYLEDKKKGRII